MTGPEQVVVRRSDSVQTTTKRKKDQRTLVTDD